MKHSQQGPLVKEPTDAYICGEDPGDPQPGELKWTDSFTFPVSFCRTLVNTWLDDFVYLSSLPFLLEPHPRGHCSAGDSANQKSDDYLNRASSADCCWMLANPDLIVNSQFDGVFISTDVSLYILTDVYFSAFAC